MKPISSLTLMVSSMPSLAMAIPPFNEIRPTNTIVGSDFPAPPQSFCKATSFFIRLSHYGIGAEDLFQTTIAGSQRYFNHKTMIDSIIGMVSCHGGSVRWLLSPKPNPKP
ncbi:hypothetical protein PspLS_01188 [Pyricularia sp. CBS 133598]|nr:hypothetical protein PspLS_01188 [Pyricularia sp. CBS 133598]